MDYLTILKSPSPDIGVLFSNLIFYLCVLGALGGESFGIWGLDSAAQKE